MKYLFFLLSFTPALAAGPTSSVDLLVKLGYSRPIAERMAVYAKSDVKNIIRLYKAGSTDTHMGIEAWKPATVFRGVAVYPEDFDPTFKDSDWLSSGIKHVADDANEALLYMVPAEDRATILRPEKGRKFFGVLMEYQIPAFYLPESGNRDTMETPLFDDRVFVSEFRSLDYSKKPTLKAFRADPFKFLKKFSPQQFEAKFKVSMKPSKKVNCSEVLEPRDPFDDAFSDQY